VTNKPVIMKYDIYREEKLRCIWFSYVEV